MNGKFFLTIIVATIIAFFAGWLVFGILLGNYYNAHTNVEAFFLMKHNTDMWAMILAIVAWSTLITWVLQKTGNTTFAKGFTTSAWLSFLVSVLFDLNMYAFWNIFDLNVILVDILVSTIVWGLIGGLAGWILGRETHTVSTT